MFILMKLVIWFEIQLLKLNFSLIEIIETKFEIYYRDSRFLELKVVL